VFFGLLALARALVELAEAEVSIPWADLEEHGLPLEVTEVSQPLPECLEAKVRGMGRVCDHANSGHAARLLRLGGERRGEEADSQGTDERPSIQRVLGGILLELLVGLQALAHEALPLIALE